MSRKREKPRAKSRPVKQDEPGRVDLSIDEKEKLIRRLQAGKLTEKDTKLLINILNAMHWMSNALSKKALSINKLTRLFGFKTEKARKLFGKGKPKDDQARNSNDADSGDAHGKAEGADDQTPANGKAKGHGKSRADDFPGAKRLRHDHGQLTAGDRCPECHNGNLRQLSPGQMVRFYGKPPLEVVVHEQERLRCNTCGKIYKAELPKDIPKEWSDAGANALVAILRYAGGVPHYRLANLQKLLGANLPQSTQWDMVERVAKPAYRVWQALIRAAAQLDLFHNDDTGMRIQDLKKELRLMKEKSSKTRTGIFTTGVVAKGADKEIALFFTGNRHAGENLGEVLAHRTADLEAPLQVCDALSRNPAKGMETILCHCLDHGRRGFVDCAHAFPEATEQVITQLGSVYWNDKVTKRLCMTPGERLEFHAEHSLPVLENLKTWCEEQIKSKKVEPNSGLGEAITYLVKHWETLTMFCRLPGVPVSNAEVERLLKTAITHRKNSLHFKTQTGALIGDIFMSLIQTCRRMHVNPYEYLVALQDNLKSVFASPDNWLPWNFQENLA